MEKENREKLSLFSVASGYGRSSEASDFTDWSTRYGTSYTMERMVEILDGTSIREKIKMSRHYFGRDGYYKRIILHYANFLKWAGVLTPLVAKDKKITDNTISKRYYQAIDYVDGMNLPNLLTEMAIKVFTDGSYYGVQIDPRGKDFKYLTLPANFCRSTKISMSGQPLIEFDVTYFEKITNLIERNVVLKSFPKEVSKAYALWKRKRGNSPWYLIPEEITICFSPYGKVPPFLSAIPKSLQYDNAVLRREELEKEEIKKVLLQKIPHLSDGQFLMEPPEAAKMHDASVAMLSDTNPNTAVLTTYADVSIESSETNNQTGASQILDTIKSNIYAQGGVPKEIFSPTGSSSTGLALQNDLSFVMILANLMSTMISRVVSSKFGNGSIQFSYTIFPLSWYNEKDFTDRAHKMASAGYSLLTPAIASGTSQNEFVNLKHLENDLLGLTDLLVPFKSAFNSAAEDENTGGRKEKDIEERTDKTEQNKQIIDEGGKSRE